MERQAWTAIFAVLLIVFAGCAGGNNGNSQSDFNEGLSIYEGHDPDGDGKYSEFKIKVQVDTTELDRYWINIWVNGKWNGGTSPTEGGEKEQFTITFNETHLKEFESGPLNVTMALARPSDNETIRSWSITVPYEPRSGQTSTQVAPKTTSHTSTVTTTSSTSPTTTTGRATTTETTVQTEWEVTVVDVIDGDTMDVRMPDGDIETIRLLGVDTPETNVNEVSPDEWENVPNSIDGRDWLANWGDKATAFAKTNLEGKEIFIETDSEEERRGSFGRLLVYAYQSESDVISFNWKLLNQGYARLYESEFTKRANFQEAEDSAKSLNSGVWGYEKYPQTTTTTESVDSGELEVNEVHADAEENDHENLNDEYIVFVNTGNEELDMGGWTVSDAADHTYYFPSDFTLEAGDSVTLHSEVGLTRILTYTGTLVVPFGIMEETQSLWKIREARRY